MALPDYSVTEYTLTLEYSTVKLDGVNVGAATALEISKHGGIWINPYDLAVKFQEVLIPKSNTSRSVADRNLQPIDLLITGQFFGADPHLFFTDYSAWLATFAKIVEQPHHKYLRLKVSDGVSTQDLRKYIELLGITQPQISHTRLTMLSPYAFRVRAIDSAMHEYAVQTETIAVVGGTGNTNITVLGNLSPTHVLFEIEKTVAGAANDIDTPTITNTAGESFTIADTITVLNEIYYVDVWEGLCLKGTAFASATEKIDKFSGKFITLDKDASPENISVTVGSGTPTFEVRAKYLKRLF